MAILQLYGAVDLVRLDDFGMKCIVMEIQWNYESLTGHEVNHRMSRRFGEALLILCRL